MEQAYDLFGEWWKTLPANRSSVLGECQNFWQRLIALVSECKQAQLVTFRRLVLRWQRVLLVLVCSNSSWWGMSSLVLARLREVLERHFAICKLQN
ncbi:hypothetical protein V6N13_114680 [Hibiscus sabdariffa]